jgi:DNA-binding transcriptional LysR family regulator
VDAFGEIGVFVRVVDRRSFTRAGQAIGLTASGVSRIVSRLEARLGVRLLERTTRSLGLTAEGAAYYERCIRILRELEDADGALAQSSRGAPRGRLRVDAPTVLGRYVLAPALPRFLDDYPDLSVSLSVRDHLIDPIAEGIDVLLRMAELRESELLHKKLGTLRFVVVASPSYLKRHGRPEVPDDLRKHPALSFMAGAQALTWRFPGRGRDVAFTPSGRLQSNSVDALREAALAGKGLANVLELHVRDEVARGALEVVLRDHEQAPVTVHALYTRESAKVRAFLDFAAKCLSGASVRR